MGRLFVIGGCAALTGGSLRVISLISLLNCRFVTTNPPKRANSLQNNNL